MRLSRMIASTLVPALAGLALLVAVDARAQAPAPAAKAAPAPAAERLAADTPRTTVRGNTFLAPGGWTIRVQGPATILGAPEGDSWLALVDVAAPDAAAAVAAAWKAYKPQAKWPLKVATDRPDKDGWSKKRMLDYQTSPNERRDVFVSAGHAGGSWTVVIYDMSQPVGEKRGSQVRLVLDRLLPKGYTPESFAGKKAHKLTPARVAELGKFVDEGRKTLGIPGVALGLVQHGKVVFAGGFGPRELGGARPVDADTLFMIASNTKALATLLLAKLVADGKMTWETPVTQLLPSFKLGDPDITRQVLVKHLICACTGMPRQDLEWLLEFQGMTPDRALATLGTMKPTSKFGALFQYSNPMAGAAGFTAGHILYPKLELGAAFDRAMQTQVFDPLGMKSTTFDYARALKGNHATAHAPDLDGKPARAVMEVNYAVIPLRPAGGAWSSVRDMLKYVTMELNEGLLPNKKRYLARDPLLARRAPQVAIGKDATYGMGLMVETKYGVTVVHHGGDMIGYHSDMLWLPEQQVGAVILTNSDPGWILRNQLRRKLLEVLFDGRPEAEAQVVAFGKEFLAGLAAERRLLTVPADPREGAKLAARYAHPALGTITVTRAGAATVFDFGEWKSEVGSRRNPDGTTSYFTTAPGVQGFEFVVGRGAKRTLVTRDAQHEYVFAEAPANQR
jgi:CubicO group peptidase (beta-lactamase class C family)